MVRVVLGNGVRLILRAFFLLTVIAAVSFSTVAFVNRPLLLTNGHFLTMSAARSEVSALGVKSGYILAAGDEQSVRGRIQQLVADSTWPKKWFGFRTIDMLGKTVLPGFVDAHSHFPTSGVAGAGLDLSSPPFGAVRDIPMLLARIREKAAGQSDHQWIIGFDYDDAALQEQRHPTRSELDLAAPEHPVYLRHRSGHMGVANSAALEALGYEKLASTAAHSVDEAGIVTSHVGRDASGRLNGLLQENAAPGMNRLVQEIPWWKLPGILFRARNEYLRAGVTTLQNSYADRPSLQVLRLAAKTGLLPQRIVVWPADDKLKEGNADKPASVLKKAHEVAETVSGSKELAAFIGWPSDDRRDIAIGAIKLIADGSPQGRTAWLSKPYLFDEQLGEYYRGFASLSQVILHERIVHYHRAGFQLAIHGNGDAAIQSILDGLSLAQRLHPRVDARHIIVHAQTMSLEQLDEAAALEVSVSFFPTHTYYWGDWHRSRVLGESRAAIISPLASADAAGVRYTIHADSPVTPMDPMQMLWSSAERQTFSGYLLGPEQRISRERALRAMTIDAAWQNHLEQDRGSLEEGKLADFIVLSANPLLVDDVRSIEVEQVWIGGWQHFP